MRSIPQVALALALLSCGDVEVVPTKPPDWAGADRVGTTPDFYDHVPKNLLMISVDTFRRDHVGHFEPSRADVNPFLTQLGATGFSLDDHTQCSNWTFAGTVCTLRGAYNEENGFIPTLSARDTYPVPQGSRFLADWLGDAGFYSILVSGNSWLGPTWGSAQGFDEAVNPNTGLATALYQEGVDRLEAAIDAGRAERWYLHLHLMEPHAPYNPPAEYLEGIEDLPPTEWDLSVKEDHYRATGTWPDLTPEEQDVIEQHLRLRYEGEIRYWDDSLRTIFADLTVRGLLDDTLVVLWNDHGEQFWEHGYQSHAYTLHAEENRAWAIFWAPNIVPDRWEGPTSAIDVAPTVLDLFEVPRPPEITGLPVGSAPDDRPRYATSVARLGVVQMVQKDQYKMTYSWTGNAKFFDVEADPGEQVDLYDPADPLVQELWGLMEPYAELAEPQIPQHGRADPAGL